MARRARRCSSSVSLNVSVAVALSLGGASVGNTILDHIAGRDAAREMANWDFQAAAGLVPVDMMYVPQNGLRALVIEKDPVLSEQLTLPQRSPLAVQRSGSPASGAPPGRAPIVRCISFCGSRFEEPKDRWAPYGSHMTPSFGTFHPRSRCGSA